MARNRSYEVTQPPTSGEVGDFALRALATRTELTLRVREEANQFSPASEEQEISFVIRALRNREDFSMSIVGESTDGSGDPINLTVSADLQEPALLSRTTI